MGSEVRARFHCGYNLRKAGRAGHQDLFPTGQSDTQFRVGIKFQRFLKNHAKSTLLKHDAESTILE